GGVVGQSGTILKTTDGGATWASQSSCTSRKFKSVYFTTSSRGYAVAEWGSFCETYNGGSTWSDVTVDGMDKSSSTQGLNSIFFVDADIGWIVGQTGRILKTTDGGTATAGVSSWSSQTSGITTSLEDVYFVNSNTGWVVGQSGTILKTTDGGTNWSTQTSGTTQWLNSVHFIDASIGWATGGSGIILKTINGGATWSIQRNAISGGDDLQNIHFVDNDLGWAIGVRNILKSTNGGTSFESDPSCTNCFSSAVAYDIQMIDSNTGWMIGANGNIYKYSDITAPTVTSVSSTATDGTYGIGSVIPITVTFDESVIVTGTPQLTLETGDTDRDAFAVDAVVDYSSGSGSSILTFNYTVALRDSSGRLLVHSENALTLNSGTIKDAAGNAATLTLPSNSLDLNKAIVIDGNVPAIVSTSIQADNLFATVIFSEKIYGSVFDPIDQVMMLIGVEKEDFNITLTQNGGTVTAASIDSILNSVKEAPPPGETHFHIYLGLTGTPSGVESIMITPKSASVYDVAWNDASTIAQGNNSVVLKDQTAPSITSVSLASDNSTIAVTFSEPVYGVNPILTGTTQSIGVDDFSLVLSNSTSGTTGVLSSDTPSSIAAN
ncbi:MAG: YCF48-related protein, partial [Anaerolineales bacterium]|nr:YCF48-related protein [Anaerolineales bacterium]